LVFSSGGVGSPSTNTEQFVLFPSGRVGVNTFTDNGIDNVQVNGSIIATTLKGTTATISGNQTIGGTLGVTGVATFSNRIDALSTLAGTGIGDIYNYSATGFGVRISAGNSSNYALLVRDYLGSSLLNVNSSTVAITPNTTIGGTLGVTGAITGSNLSGTGTRMVEASSTGLLSATKIVDAGTYTPTATAIQNTSGITASVAQYTRIGNIVTVSGSVAFTQGASTGATQIDLTLPIASTFTTASQLAGTANDWEQSNQQSGVMKSINTGTKARFYFVTSTSSALTYDFYYTYTYQIL
jgi:hypothetical protein